MGDKSGTSRIRYAPIMTPEQKALMSGMLAGVAGQMSGFPFGEPWGGPYGSSYRVNPFFMSSGLGGDKVSDIIDGGGGKKEKPPVPQRTEPLPIPTEQGVKKTEAGSKKETKTPTWAEVLSPGYTSPVGYSSLLSSGYTNSFANPWYNLLTGNFPRMTY